MKEKLTIDKLKAEAKAFCIAESKIQNKSLFGVTDGKAVGTHIEHKFQEQLRGNKIINSDSLKDFIFA